MRAIFTLMFGFLLLAAAVSAQNWIPTNDPSYYGPFNGIFWPDGDGLKKALVKDDTVTRADSPWTLHAWVWLDEAPKAPTLIAGIGNPEDEYSRYLGIDGDKLILWAGKGNILSGAAALTPKKWHFLAASFDGHDFHISAEGASVADGKLNHLPMAQLAVTTSAAHEKNLVKIHVRVENIGATAAIETKFTLMDSDGATRVLPAYYGDNYVSLLPGESREIDIEAPSSSVKAGLTLGLRGWNVSEKVVKVGGEK